MTEKEKMLAGLPYCSADRELREQSRKADALIRRYNASAPDEADARREILCELFEGIGKGARVNAPLTVDYGCNISLGDYSFINKGCTLLDTNKIIIGNRVLIAPNVKIYTSYHSKIAEERFAETDGELRIITMTKPVKIGDDTWIGGGATILPGVEIGSNVIIGAGSVVTRDIPDNVTAVGNPCRIVRNPS